MGYFVLLRKNNVRDHHSAKDSPSIVLMAELAGLLMFFILSSILVFTCTPSILAELSGKPKPPIVEILGLSVSGLNNNVSYKTVSSKWGVELAAKNPNMFSTLYVDHIEGMVLYKNEVLGVTSLENKPIVLGPREHEFVSFKVWRKDWNIDGDQPSVKEWVVANLVREQNKKNKNIKFSVQMGVWGQIKSGWWLRKSVIMNPRCMDLSINLVHDRGFGMLSNKRPIRCYVPMLDH